jgi:hypothetical protein
MVEDAMDKEAMTNDDGTMDEMSEMMYMEVPPELDTATERASDQGLYQVSVQSNMDPVAINEIHTWTLHVETSNGQPVDDANIAINGGMPAHNHGFPTEPQITENLGNGDYLIEGVRFNMTGWWEMRFEIAAGGQSDTVSFNLVLEN